MGVTKHNLSRSHPYKRWGAMKQRCRNKNVWAYQYYGARGIDYCDEWDNFEKFWEDMGGSYFEGASLDRIDNSLGYSKGNCRWIEKNKQQRHRTNIKLHRLNGKLYTIPELAALAGVGRYTMYARIKLFAWDVEKAVSKGARPARR